MLNLLQFFTREMAEVIANSCNQHSIHYLSADHIGHHLVFETHQGKTRVFQCSVKARVTVTDGTEHFVGWVRTLASNNIM
jgi:penicillin V acylase-like amidase (Ntn superfamily)